MVYGGHATERAQREPSHDGIPARIVELERRITLAERLSGDEVPLLPAVPERLN
jgi:hypothetical protein